MRTKLQDVETCRRSAFIILLLITSTLFALQYKGLRHTIGPAVDMLSSRQPDNQSTEVYWLKVNINEMTVGEMFEYFE